MVTPSLATVDDLADWLGEVITADSADGKRASRLLRLASALVRRESGRKWLDEPGGLVADLPEEVVDVTCAVAGRGFTNPNAETSVRLDDYSTYQKVDEAGLYLTDSEKDILSQFSGARFGGLGTVSVERGDIRRSLRFESEECILPPYY